MTNMNTEGSSGVGCPFSSLAAKGAVNPHLHNSRQLPTPTNVQNRKSTRSSLTSIVVALVVFFGLTTFALYTLLPVFISSSTSLISQINGEQAVSTDHLLNVAEKLVERHVFHQKEEEAKHLHHSPPTPQFGVRYLTEPNPLVKPLEPHFRASTAMSMKFRQDR
jgi:hypothetical protein